MLDMGLWLQYFYIRDDVNMFVAQHGLYITDDALLVKHSRPIDYFQQSFENPRVNNMQQSSRLLLMKSIQNDTLYLMRFLETEKLHCFDESLFYGVVNGHIVIENNDFKPKFFTLSEKEVKPLHEIQQGGYIKSWADFAIKVYDQHTALI